VTRWQPDSRGRLAQAALELYGERGFDETTVAEIAARAGLTERTFFRYFADKREVLFGGGAEFEQLFVVAVAEAPAGSTALQAIAPALDAGGAFLEERRDFARQRQAIIAATPELRERELSKLASLSAALAAALRARGVEEPTASLTAETGIAVFRVAFERWAMGADARDLPTLVRESLERLSDVVAA
jgi:AcrR family transcriptional regulator